MVEIKFRTVEKTEVNQLADFIIDLATYEKAEVLTKQSLADHLLAHGLTESHAKFHALFALANEIPVGYAIYYYAFSPTKGSPVLYLEDLYVQPEHRAKQIGSKFMYHLASIAYNEACYSMEWGAYTWNKPAQAFYEKIKAIPGEKRQSQCKYSFNHEMLKAIAEGRNIF